MNGRQLQFRGRGSEVQAMTEEEEEKLQCVGRLEVQKHRQVGFICGSLPVPTTTYDDDIFNCGVSTAFFHIPTGCPYTLFNWISLSNSTS